MDVLMFIGTWIQVFPFPLKLQSASDFSFSFVSLSLSLLSPRSAKVNGAAAVIDNSAEVANTTATGIIIVHCMFHNLMSRIIISRVLYTMT